MYENVFNDRRIWIVTKHRKETVMSSLLTEVFAADVLVYAADTDLLGTFTGEIERANDPLTTLRNKCFLASDISEEDIVIANEGSFGLHPYLFFVPADEELIMMYDKKNKIEIVAKELSTETNFNGKYITSKEELVEFAEKSLFPSHRLNIRDKEKGTDFIKKGIDDPVLLHAYFNECQSLYGTVFVETDMRAMHNPSRMKVIKACTDKLIEKMRSTCPECKFPGFSITDVKPGLPCSICSAPTRSALKYISICTNCKFIQEQIYPHHKQVEDPMYCDNCNP